MKQLIRKFKQISILIFAIAFIGCEDDDVILPQVIAGFTYNLNIDTGTVTFINISENATNHEWDFGDESSSALINPVKVYTNGTYTITLNAKNVAGASDTFQDEITILIPEIATLPISFDGANTNYDAETINGASFDIVDNPDLSGSNTSASKVGSITNIGAQFEGIFFDLGADIDLTTDKSISMNFWADAPVDVLLKLEEGTGGDVEVTSSHGGTGWEIILFDFSSSDSFGRLTLFVDGPSTTAGTFYIDDIMQTETVATCTAETTESLSAADLNMTFMSDSATIAEDGATYERISNPDFENAVNSSCYVGKITKLGNNPWDNNQIDLDAKLDFNANAGLKIKVWSAIANTEVRIKLEEIGNAGNNVEQFLTTSVTSGWEELTFPFGSGDSDKFDKIVIFFDLNANNTDTYYFDDFMVYTGSGGGGGTCTAETVESYSAADLNMTFLTDPSAFIISDGAGFEWIDNPDFDNAVNTSCKVGKITKAGNNPWDNNQFDLDAKLDFNANEGLKIKVWSALANTEVRIKLEEIGNAGNNVELPLTTSVTSAWEELTFPFSSADSDKFNKIVIFFDLNAGNTDTYYFDDFKLYSGTGGGGTCIAETSESYSAADLNMTLLTDPSASIISDGAGFEWVDNPDFDNAVNSSCKVGKITKSGQFDWDNNQIDLDAKLDFNANAGLKIKVWSALANTEVRIKLEEIGNAGNNVELPLTTSVTSAWEELTFPFSSADSDKFNKIVIFFDLNAGNTDTYYFDDLKVYAGGGGGGDCPDPPAGDLISNGDFEAGEVCWQLIDNGGTVTISSTVSSGSGSKSGQIRTAPLKNPGIKQERFAAGTALPNTEYKVTFDIKADASTPLIDGAVFQAFVFSEGVDGGTTGAVQHVLVQGLGNVSTSWETKTYTFVSGGAAANVEGGFSFLAELVCGGAGTCDGIINIDNVSITLN